MLTLVWVGSHKASTNFHNDSEDDFLEGKKITWKKASLVTKGQLFHNSELYTQAERQVKLNGTPRYWAFGLALRCPHLTLECMCLIPGSDSWLRLPALGGSSNSSSHWVLATHKGQLDGIPSSQLWPLPNSGHCGFLRSEPADGSNLSFKTKTKDHNRDTLSVHPDLISQNSLGMKEQSNYHKNLCY